MTRSPKGRDSSRRPGPPKVSGDRPDFSGRQPAINVQPGTGQCNKCREWSVESTNWLIRRGWRYVENQGGPKIGTAKRTVTHRRPA